MGEEVHWKSDRVHASLSEMRQGKSATLRENMKKFTSEQHDIGNTRQESVGL